MHVVFRADASLQIGTGHVMRCLTLADSLRSYGAHCIFFCRPHPGQLIELICQRGHEVIPLKPPRMNYEAGVSPRHAVWLGTSWEEDALEMSTALSDQALEWLVVDHYALDARWETILRPHCGRLLVIDDLADRPHDCDLLLDQNLGRSKSDYALRVKHDAEFLIGPEYALLRPEFSQWRKYSLARRRQPELKNLLITFGGVDRENFTEQVLDAIQDCSLPADFRIVVVMGHHAPWIAQVQSKASAMPWSTEVVTNVSNMAQLMAESDLAIGAAGGTAWERCALGLPTLLFVLAENQEIGAKALQSYGACIVINDMKELIAAIDRCALEQTCSQELLSLSIASAQLTSGVGVSHLVSKMFG